MFEWVDAEKFKEIIDSGVEITSLEFGPGFNQSIEPLRGNHTIKTLIFGHGFNQPIGALAGNQTIESITFGDNFNQSIEPLRGNHSIKTLIFGDDFNQSIGPLRGNQTIETLKFGYVFNQSIEPLRGNHSIKTLEFGYAFNQPIDALFGNQSIETLWFRGNFNQPVDALVGNQTIKTLTLEGKFKQPVKLLMETTKIEQMYLPGVGIVDLLSKRSIARDCPKFLSAVEKRDKLMLEELIVSGFPVPMFSVPIFPYENPIVAGLGCYQYDPADKDFLTSFSRVRDTTSVSKLERKATHFWLDDSEVFDDLQDSVERFNSGESIDEKHLKKHRVLHKLASRKPFMGKTYLYHRTPDVVLDNPVIHEKIVFQRFTIASLAYEMSLETGRTEGQLFLLEVDEETPGSSLEGDAGKILLPDGIMWEIVNITHISYRISAVEYPEIIHAKYIGLLSHEEMLAIP